MKCPLAALPLVLAAAMPAEQAQGPAAGPALVTNSIGMELVRIEPGTMQVGVFHPDCANGARQAPGLGRGAPPGAGAEGRAASGGAAPLAQGRGAPRDPRMVWDAADIAACEAATRADRSDGFRVTLAKPYLIGKTEVTQAQWKAVMGTNPSLFQGTRVEHADDHPVDSVSWADAQAFVKALNAKEKTKSYRLPTEFEWEYACRAGGSGQQTWTDIRAQAVLGLGLPGRGGGNRGGGAAPAPAPEETAEPETPAQYAARTGMSNAVATKPANAWGIYDMLGNVWEWVADPYNGKLFADPTPPKSGPVHVLKGGGFFSDVKNAICATHAFGPGDSFAVGFRIVKDLP
jgi:formylglycine-generating enzyme required for sulfatase activity